MFISRESPTNFAVYVFLPFSIRQRSRRSESQYLHNHFGVATLGQDHVLPSFTSTLRAKYAVHF